MILSDDEVEQRLASKDNLVNIVQVLVKRTDLKREGDCSIPSAVKNLIAHIAIEGDENQAEIADQFGISQASVSGIMRGLVGDRKDEELTDTVVQAKLSAKEKVDQCHEAAIDSLMVALTKTADLLPVDQMLTAKGASSIAKDLSAVAANLKKGSEDNTGVNKTLVILHGVERKRESAFACIEA